MKRYQWILFDADETLFYFDAFRGLQLMFSRLEVNFTHEDYEAYQVINKPLWVNYQNGAITAEELQHERFAMWSTKLQISTQTLNSYFLEAMAEIAHPLEGAIQLIRSLKGKIKLGIITNGLTQLQKIRLERTGLHDCFDILVISEEVGFAKPNPKIFDHALSLMNHPPRNQVLMVGDNPESDIIGGLHAGLDTCWLNIHNKETPEHIIPHYQVSSLMELHTLLSEKNQLLLPA